MTASAVVFAYHNVGVRCLSVLLDQGVHVPVVVTHQDNALEPIWFDSVAEMAHLHGIRVVTPANPNLPEINEDIAALAPDFLFSFYYRLMLKPSLLRIAKRGAFNMHGSLLPKYRGRVPVNWAIINGEKETGATLHEMVAKPDAGRIVDQQAAPILENDTAQQVFTKVTVAAEMVLSRALPRLIDGTAVLRPQDLSQGSYFGARKPEDGVIDWRDSAEHIHNLVRAVAPPYPGASTSIAGQPARVLQTVRERQRRARYQSPHIYVEGDVLLANCGDAGILRIVALEINGRLLPASSFQQRFGAAAPFGEPA